jgi:hypothetical protein
VTSEVSPEERVGLNELKTRSPRRVHLNLRRIEVMANPAEKNNTHRWLR